MARPTVMALLTSAIASGCMDVGTGAECTPADSTHSCCVKKHLAEHLTVVCDGIDSQEDIVSASASPFSGKVAATAVAALTLKDIREFEAAQIEIEEILKDCARQAEREVNQRWLGERQPTKEDCAKEIERQPDGRTLTQAVRWGEEKHEAARKCLEVRLGQRIKGHFSLEQRYQYDPRTGRKSLLNPREVDELLRQGRANELKGTLQPDVVIHAGDPLHAWAVYDFKFPCPEDNEPSWSRYIHGPYQNRLQGEVYSRAFGVIAVRVAPWWGIIRRSTF